MKRYSPSAVGDLHLRLNQRRTAGGDGDTGQDRAGVVGDRAVDAAAEILCRADAGRGQERHQARPSAIILLNFIRTLQAERIGKTYLGAAGQTG